MLKERKRGSPLHYAAFEHRRRERRGKCVTSSGKAGVLSRRSNLTPRGLSQNPDALTGVRTAIQRTKGPDGTIEAPGRLVTNASRDVGGRGRHIVPLWAGRVHERRAWALGHWRQGPDSKPAAADCRCTFGAGGAMILSRSTRSHPYGECIGLYSHFCCGSFPTTLT